MTRIKVCGITNRQDANAAVAAGADAVGLILAESPRRVDPSDVAGITVDVPLFVATVGVFVNARLEQIIRTMSTCGLNAVQLHGDEDEEEAVHALGPKRVIQAVRLASLDQIGLVAGSAASLVLVEPLVEGVRGGSGQRLDDELARAAIATGRPIMLAGGLSPENVYDAVVRLRPYAVDVGSGVEAAPGRKDHGKIRDFVAAVREADRVVDADSATA